MALHSVNQYSYPPLDSLLSALQRQQRSQPVRLTERVVCEIASKDGVICVTDTQSAFYKHSIYLAQQRQFASMWDFANMQVAVNSMDQLCILMRVHAAHVTSERDLRDMVSRMCLLLLGGHQ